MQPTTHCCASAAHRLAQKRRDLGAFGVCRLPSRFGGVSLTTLVPVVCSAAVFVILLADLSYSVFSPQLWLLISYFGFLQEGTPLALTDGDVSERRRTLESEPPNIRNFLRHSTRSCVVQSVAPVLVEASQANQDGDSTTNEVTTAVDLTWPRRIHFQYWAGTHRVRASSDQKPYQLLIGVTRHHKIPGNTGGFERSVVASDSLLVPKTGAPVRQLGSRVDEARTLSDLNNGPAIVCVILIAVVGAVSVTAGTGGGAIFVPLMQLLMRFNTFEATATSQCLMTGSSLAGLILNFVRRNPVVDMPLIDMDMVLLLGPIQMCGSSIGVIVNRMLPAWLIIVLLVVCLLYETIRLMRRLCDQPKRARNETQLTAAEHTQQTRGRLGMAVPVEEQPSAGEMGVATRKAAGDEEKKQDGNETHKEQKTCGIRENDVCENQEVLVSSEDENVIHKVERDTEAAALDNADHRRRKTKIEAIKYLWERHELTKWSILLTIWTINLTVTFIKGGKRSTVHVVPFCSVSYWIIYVIGCLFLATASLLWGYKLLKRHRKRLRLHQLCYSSIEFTPGNVHFLLAQAFFAGMLGAIVGIGGGLILGPALLLKGVVPSVSSSLTSCLVLLSASTAGTINLTSRMAPPSISGVLFLVLFFTTLVGKSLLDRFVGPKPFAVTESSRMSLYMCLKYKRPRINA